jgi:hypothetical protein
MALYHHVGSKQELLIPDPDLPWPERLRAMGAGLRETARRHPDAFPMLMRRPATTLATLRTRDVVYGALRDAGVPAELVPRAERLMSTFMIGFAASEAGGRFAHHDTTDLDADLAWLEALVRSLLP